MSEINPASLNYIEKIQWLNQKKMETMGYSLPDYNEDFDPEAELATWLAGYNQRVANIAQLNQGSEADQEKKHQDRIARIGEILQQEKLEKEQLYQRIEALERQVAFLMRRETQHGR